MFPAFFLLRTESRVNVTFGTDLLGGLQRQQAREFSIRAEVMPIIDVIRSATLTASKLLQREGELGVIAPGAAADFVVTNENPMEDITGSPKRACMP